MNTLMHISLTAILEYSFFGKCVLIYIPTNVHAKLCMRVTVRPWPYQNCLLFKKTLLML